jgi:ankyrin repeat protein
VNAVALHNFTALHFAADSGSLEACDTILAHGQGVNVNAQTSTGRTPLHLAAIAGNLEICRLLIDHDANVNATDCDACTPTHYAAQNGHKTVLEMLL